MSVVGQPLTWNDIKDWPVDVGQRTELVHGELVVSPSPKGNHAVILENLILELGPHIRSLKLGRLLPGPVDVILASDVVYVSDLCFIESKRLAIFDGNVQGPPDLCIEVLSESNHGHDTIVKFQDYARYGVIEYWLVDPRENEVSTWKNRSRKFALIGRAKPGEFISSKVLPDLRVDAARILNPYEI